ncbi:MAG TPA: DUF1906 domain-containing protein [Solirubrobacteraceae bacterium]|nr:DUF1906 domain-containing protein [Solirubrobacteraceae bacterium]
MSAAALGAMPASAAAHGALKTVRYRAYALRVPASWPVFRLASDPSACVRFDRHAVYLGRPSSEQRCPSHVAGRTEAVLVEPLAAGGTVLTNARSARARGSAGRLTFPARGVAVTATWARDPGAIERALGVRALPTAPPSAAAPAPAAVARAAAARFRSDTVNIGGLGFDSCSAPSPSAMSAWLASSPFRAAALYIGGANSACSQPNLTASYVSSESAAGWQFIPVYVGLQAPTSSCGCQTIVPAQATAEGTAAATDAVTQAQALGIGSGNPIYYDMENYSQTATSTAAVLGFLSAWTSQLHAYGYISGVYGSGSSGMTDLADAWGTSLLEPDDIWIADWNNQATASDAYVPAADWANSQRLHQYRGGHVDSYGGVKLDIDSDYLDGATATAGVGTVAPTALPDGTFVSYAGKTYRLAGGAPLYVHSWSPFGGAQPTIALTPTEWKALSPVPADGTFIRATGTGKVYRIAGGAPVYAPSWTPFGGAQPVIQIDRWDILNISNPAAHLGAAPATGTIVEGLPSGVYWLFSSGWRAQTAASTTAVGVADAGLGSFLESPTVTRSTLTGVAKRAPKLRVVLTAGANAPSLRTFVLQLPRGLSFSRSAASVAKGVVVWWTANGKPLAETARLSHGKLTISLAAPARKVLITVGSPALSATKALATEVRAGVASTLEVILEAVDSRHNRDVLTLDPRTS